MYQKCTLKKYPKMYPEKVPKKYPKMYQKMYPKRLPKIRTQKMKINNGKFATFLGTFSVHFSNIGF